LGQLIVQNSDAQFNLYAKLKRGQPCPYDSCVATELNQWRRESAYINELRSENKSLHSENESLQSEINLADSTSETYRVERDILAGAIIRKDSINERMSSDITNIHRIASDALAPKKWFERPEIWGIGGLIIGLIIGR
jgi:hypothetical protein